MSAEDPGSITRWLSDLKAGRPEAVDAIWRRYYHRVLGLARHRLRRASPQAIAEVEDVALSAFNGLAAGATRGQFAYLEDRADLWHVLARITVRTARRRGEWYERWKRSGRRPGVEGEVDGYGYGGGLARAGPSAPADRDDDPEPLGQVASKDPMPEVALMLREQLDQLLARLENPVLRQIAGWRMEGLSNAEIAGRLGCALRTVERKLELIRLTWEHLGSEERS
ncbi:MAG: ECF-type sigma factor [Isosphaeraceae bacterium]